MKHIYENSNLDQEMNTVSAFRILFGFFLLLSWLHLAHSQHGNHHPDFLPAWINFACVYYINPEPYFTYYFMCNLFYAM
jgi:hypothetical protein